MSRWFKPKPWTCGTSRRLHGDAISGSVAEEVGATSLKNVSQTMVGQLKGLKTGHKEPRRTACGTPFNGNGITILACV
uniref:Uncharacterized protein n=1 Tax=Globodera rostochiensis TaxID=31243 RepID=A0A914GWZ3_GLORO